MTCTPPEMPRAMLPPCRHCAEPAPFRVRLPYGCFVFDDREQWLCPYHLDRLDAIPHRVLEDLTATATGAG